MPQKLYSLYATGYVLVVANSILYRIFTIADNPFDLFTVAPLAHGTAYGTKYLSGGPSVVL